MRVENNVNIYKNYLLAENEKTNLISRKMSSDDLDLHIEDSLKIFDHWQGQGERVIDVGSGAGMPGLVMAIRDINNHYTLLEADLKKSRFLMQAMELLTLQHLQVIRERAEVIGQDIKYREKFDAVCSRAVASMRVVLEYCLPLARIGGIVWLWKGPRYLKEIEEAEKALKLLGGEVEKVILYQLGEDRQRAIVQVRKKEASPEQYPRRAGMPLKRPL
jgi:16S rRNA (guanine527-N7)-methyltransferase